MLYIKDQERVKLSTSKFCIRSIIEVTVIYGGKRYLKRKLYIAITD